MKKPSMNRKAYSSSPTKAGNVGAVDWGQATADGINKHVCREYSMLSAPIRDALRLALETHEIHQQQKRKGKNVPYITHPLTVGLILARAGADQQLIIAGILHDTLEDSASSNKVTYEILQERFGKYVADTVMSVTEPNRGLPWKERKRAALKHLKTMKWAGLCVKAADTISNVSELLDDYARQPSGMGDEVFERFNAPKADIIANYLAVINVLIEKPLIPAGGGQETLGLDLLTLRDDLSKLQ